MDALDWERCAGSLVLRNWRPGDSLSPQKTVPGAEKIKTLFRSIAFRSGNAARGRWWRRAPRETFDPLDAQFGVAEGFGRLAAKAASEILLIREAGESKYAVSASIEAETRAGLKPLQRSNAQSGSGRAGRGGIVNSNVKTVIFWVVLICVAVLLWAVVKQGHTQARPGVELQRVSHRGRFRQHQVGHQRQRYQGRIYQRSAIPSIPSSPANYPSLSTC